MLTIAAPSRTIMSTSGTKLFASSVNGRRSSRHRSRSDVVASLNFPLSDIEGGDDWFSCWKFWHFLAHPGDKIKSSLLCAMIFSVGMLEK